jgi:hypothetical protein
MQSVTLRPPPKKKPPSLPLWNYAPARRVPALSVKTALWSEAEQYPAGLAQADAVPRDTAIRGADHKPKTI